MYLSPSRMVWQQCQVLCPISVWDERSSAGCGGANAVISPLLAGLAAGKPIASQAGCPARDDGAGCAGSHSRSADERQEANTALPSWACGNSGLPAPNALLLRSGQLQRSLELARNQMKSNRTFYACLPVIAFCKDADF